MKLNQPAVRRESKIPAADVHPAYLVSIVGLGLQESQPFQGQVKPPARKVRFTYELPLQTSDFNGEQKPLIISEEFPLSGNEKSKCYKRVKGMNPSFDITKDSLQTLVKYPCLVQVVHKKGSGKNADRTFADIASVTALPGFMSQVLPADTFNPAFLYDPYNHDQEVYDLLPDFLKEKIESRLDNNKQPDTRAAAPSAAPSQPQESNQEGSKVDDVTAEPTAYTSPTTSGSDDW